MAYFCAMAAIRFCANWLELACAKLAKEFCAFFVRATPAGNSVLFLCCHASAGNPVIFGVGQRRFLCDLLALALQGWQGGWVPFLLATPAKTL